MSDLVGQCDTLCDDVNRNWSRVMMMDGREAKIMDSDNDDNRL